MRLYTMSQFHAVTVAFSGTKVIYCAVMCTQFIVFFHNALDVLMHYFSPEVTLKMTL